ncbi:site-specific DNA-methyltransferase [Tenacibaculum sp. A30]|uniref:site-specific DNA-methyltransferase n=1 Tax=Tenacibaculum sp. A30 TaxID=3442644 RepID=UPI003EBC1807
MSKEQKITGNIQPPNKDLEILKQNFPSCFDKNGEFDFEKFKTQLSKNEINFSKESYGMDWLGKSYARLLATDETTTLLKEDETFNQKGDNKNSENLLIKGDNLEVLKHLSNAYYEKVKMIYIDPPYNTGSDGFVYEDDRKFDVPTLMELAGVSEERAKRILDFTQSKSNSHSAWLTFMYPRLYIAKQLLKVDGAIFISIDDNEVAQLRLLMDEVFGEENFVGEIPTIMNLKGNQDNFGFADCHEYFLIYAKNKEKCELFEFDIDEEEIFNNWNEDEYGLWKKADGLRRTGEDASRINRPKGWFPVFISQENKIYVTDDDKPLSKQDTIIYPINEEKEELSWSWGKPKIKNETFNLIVTDARSGGKSIYKKQRPKLGDLPTKKPKSFFYKSDYSTSTATTLLKTFFGKKIFKGPKPVPFIKDLLIIGMKQNDLILDFFAGSGTTGDAVMQLNAEDGGNRKFILAQLPELIDPKSNKTAYDFVKDELKIDKPTIFDITKERLIRASKKIQEDHKDKDLSNQDLGFKVFETMPIWEDYNFEADELGSQFEMFDESKLTEEDLKALLVTWKTYDGVPLTVTIQETDLNGYTAYYVSEKLYLMDKGFKTQHLKALLEKIDSDRSFNPTTIIAFGYHFESKSLREISENIKSYANKKSIDIDFITRY